MCTVLNNKFQAVVFVHHLHRLILGADYPFDVIFVLNKAWKAVFRLEYISGRSQRTWATGYFRLSLTAQSDPQGSMTNCFHTVMSVSLA